MAGTTLDAPCCEASHSQWATTHMQKGLLVVPARVGVGVGDCLGGSAEAHAGRASFVDLSAVAPKTTEESASFEVVGKEAAVEYYILHAEGRRHALLWVEG